MAAKKKAAPKRAKSLPFVVVRTHSAGVFAGELVKRTGKEGEMRNAIRLWYWKGAASLSQLAVEGVSCPGECKFSVPVARHELTEIIEVLHCTDAARTCIVGVKPWRS